MELHLIFITEILDDWGSEQAVAWAHSKKAVFRYNFLPLQKNSLQWKRTLT